MRLTLTLEMDNAAFEDAITPTMEAGRILIEAGIRLKAGYTQGTLYDINGNGVGHFKVHGKRRAGR